MSSVQNNGRDWLLDYGVVDEGPAADYLWASQVISDPTFPSAILEFNGSWKPDNFSATSHGKKRTRSESCAVPGTKACREKMRRDRLNDSFAELCSILDPGKPPRADKISVLSDVTRLLNQLRLETQQLKDANEALQLAIKNLKTEKLELRDEKVRLKAEKERMEQMLKRISITPLFPQAAAAAFHTPAVVTGNKPVAYPNYLPVGMWQWIPPAALDTSQDHNLRPPVA